MWEGRPQTARHIKLKERVLLSYLKKLYLFRMGSLTGLIINTWDEARRNSHENKYVFIMILT